MWCTLIRALKPCATHFSCSRERVFFGFQKTSFNQFFCFCHTDIAATTIWDTGKASELSYKLKLAQKFVSTQSPWAVTVTCMGRAQYSTYIQGGGATGCIFFNSGAGPWRHEM